MGTPFTKTNLRKAGGGYVEYVTEDKIVVVARFKNAKSSCGPLMTLLRKHFTVEEFFARKEAGESTMEIAESKGFVMTHIKKWLREGGYEVSPEGNRQHTLDQVKRFGKNAK